MQNSLAKKIFAVGVAASTVLLSLSPLVAAAAAHPEGTNVLEADGTVGMIINGQFRPYTSAGAFLSYGFNSWSGVATANADDLALPVGAFIPPQDGTVFCATATKGTDVKGECSLITGGQKAAFISAAVFTGQGFSFANAISGDSSFLTKTANVTNPAAAHLPGTLIHFVYNGHDTVFLVGTSGLLGVPDINTFNSWGYSFANAVQGNAADQAMSVTGVMAMRVAGQLSPTATTGSTGTTPTPTGGSTVISGNVSASLASDSPAAGTLVSESCTSGSTCAGQTSADLAHFTFTGTGTVTQVVVNRIGVSADTSVNNVYLYQGNNRITDAGSLSNGVVTFSNSSGLFTVSGSAEISVRADIAGNISGQTIGAQLTSFTVANGSPMSTSISGNLFSIAEVSNLASATVPYGSDPVTSSGASNGTAGTINAGTLNAILWSAPVTVSQRNVLLKYIQFKQIGSISQSAIQNLKLYLDGTQVGATASISNSGSNSNVVIFDLTGSPVTMGTGSHTLELHGDVVTGTSYTYNFSIQQAADVVLYDTNYNVNIPFTYSNGSQVFQLSPGTTTISPGTLSFQQDPTFTQTQFVANQSQVTLGQWTGKAYGEDLKVLSLQVQLLYTGAPSTSPSAEGFNNLSLYVNGGMVGSSQSAIIGQNGCLVGSPTTPSPCVYTFGSGNLFTIPAGTTVTIAVKGDSVLNNPTAVTAVQANLVAPINSLQGVTSYTLNSTQQTATGISLSTSSSNATLSKNTGYTNQTIGSNMTNQLIGSYVIQASSADGVRVNSLTVGVASTTISGIGGGGIFTGTVPTGLANLYISTPSGTTTPVNPSASNTFSVNSFTIPANQTATINVYADISNVTGSLTTTMFGSGNGSSSNQAVTLTSQNGQKISVGSGTINNPILQTSSPVASFVIGGSTNQPAATFNFVASNGGATIQEMDFYASTTQAGAITSVTVGGITSPVVGSTSTVTGLNIAVPTNYSGIDVPVTVTYSTIGLNGLPSPVPVQLVLSRVKYLSGSTTQYLTGAALASAVSNKFILVGSAPTVTLTSSGNTLTSGVTIGSIVIAANSSGNVIASTVPFSISANNVSSVGGTLSLVDASTGQTAGSVTFATGTLITVPLNADNNIAAGSSKTYNIVLGTVNTVTSANNYSVTVGMGAASSFLFNDVNGGPSAINIPGAANGTTYIVNYPTNTATSHQ